MKKKVIKTQEGFEIIDDKNEIIWKDRSRPFLGLPISFTKYSLDKEVLTVETGFFNLNTDKVRLYRILDISLNRTFYQRLFGIGTIVINSSDKTLGNFKIKNIKNSKNISVLLSKLVERNRDEKREF